MTKVYGSVKLEEMAQPMHARNEVIRLLEKACFNSRLEFDKVRILCADIRLHFVDIHHPNFHNGTLKDCEILKVIRLYKDDNEVGSNGYEEFMKSLDFKYESSHGGQQLYGTIWFSDGTWATRGEYDGSEWWEHHRRPAIPEHLTSKLCSFKDLLKDLK